MVPADDLAQALRASREAAAAAQAAETASTPHRAMLRFVAAARAMVVEEQITARVQRHATWTFFKAWKEHHLAMQHKRFGDIYEAMRQEYVRHATIRTADRSSLVVMATDTLGLQLRAAERRSTRMLQMELSHGVAAWLGHCQHIPMSYIHNFSFWVELIEEYMRAKALLAPACDPSSVESVVATKEVLFRWLDPRLPPGFDTVLLREAVRGGVL